MITELRQRPEPGEYLADERDLFRVERIFGDRALLEDCRTEVLLDIEIAELSRLRHVEPRAGETPPVAGSRAT